MILNLVNTEVFGADTNVFFTGENNVEKITTIIEDKKIKTLRLSKYNFSEKIKEKLLNYN